MTRRTLSAMLAFVFAALSAACSGGGANTSGNPPSRDPKMSAAEYRYGRAPKPNANVTYQSDVVLIGGGANSIRSRSADGMTWTIDGKASGTKNLAPGKIMFATNEAVGRVLGLRKVDGDLAVTLGPITITDLVSRADMHYSGPLDLSKVIATVGPMGSGKPAPLGPGPGGAPASAPATTLAAPSDASAAAPPTTVSTRRVVPDVVPASFGGGSQPDLGALPTASGLSGAQSMGNADPTPPGTLPPSAPSIPSYPINKFKTYPLNGSNGFGYEINYNQNGTKVHGNVRLYADSPRLGFDLVVGPSGVQTATVSLKGLVGVSFEFQAGSALGLHGNIHYMLPLPVDFHIPLYALGLPLPVDAHFSQVLLLSSGFSAKNATLTFGGDYAYGGRIAFGYDHGRSGITEYPSGFQVRKSLVQSIGGPSIGINSFIFGHGFRVLVGMGLGGFAFGPYVQLNNSLSLINGSDLAIVKCRGATYLMDLGYGIGYSLPKPVVAIINFFLRALNLKQIQASGGTPMTTVNLIRKAGVFPKVNACQGAA